MRKKAVITMALALTLTAGTSAFAAGNTTTANDTGRTGGNAITRGMQNLTDTFTGNNTPRVSPSPGTTGAYGTGTTTGAGTGTGMGGTGAGGLGTGTNNTGRTGMYNNNGLFDNDNNRFGTRTNNYRTNAATNDGMDWGWLGLVGLLGLAGLRGRNDKRDTTRV